MDLEALGEQLAERKMQITAEESDQDTDDPRKQSVWRSNAGERESGIVPRRQR